MIRTRIAPSPTGENLHIGNLYTALFNWVVAKKNKGKFIVRIEDTDRTRYVEGSEDRILESLRNFGLDHDEGVDIGGPYAPYRQSERLDIYKEYIQKMIDSGNAYYCFCKKERLDEMRKNQMAEKRKSKYDRYCLANVNNAEERIKNGEEYVVRLRVPDRKDIVFEDVVRGKIVISTEEVDDQVLVKSDGFPTYHLAVVIDDHLMKITHVIRAEEWISSTPKHVLLYEAFGWKLPVFAHIPILRNPDKSKLSKRKNAVWVSWYLEEGFLPEAVINYLALLGWSHPDEDEIFDVNEFVRHFELKDLNTVGPIFDVVKLKWMNQKYIQKMSDKELGERLIDFSERAKGLDKDVLKKLIPLVKTRISTLKEFDEVTSCFVDKPEIKPRNEVEYDVLGDLLNKLDELSNWEKDEIFPVLKSIMKDNGVRMPVLYYLITGKERGLPLPESMEILGRDEVIERLKAIS